MCNPNHKTGLSIIIRRNQLNTISVPKENYSLEVFLFPLIHCVYTTCVIIYYPVILFYYVQGFCKFVFLDKTRLFFEICNVLLQSGQGRIQFERSVVGWDLTSLTSYFSDKVIILSMKNDPFGLLFPFVGWKTKLRQAKGSPNVTHQLSDRPRLFLSPSLFFGLSSKY